MALAALVAHYFSFDLGVLPVLGWVLMAVAVALTVAAALAMLRAKTPVLPRRNPSTLVTSGVFSVSRNPIYLADILVLVGWCLAIGQPLAAVLAYPLYWVLDRRFAAPEERRLTALFGDEFATYASRVRRWL